MTYKEAIEHARLNKDFPINPIEYAADPRIKASLQHAAQSAVNDGFGLHANHITAQINRLDALVSAQDIAAPLGIDLAPHAETQVLPNETGVDIGSADLQAGSPVLPVSEAVGAAESAALTAAAIEQSRRLGLEIIATGLSEPQDASGNLEATRVQVDPSDATSASEDPVNDPLAGAPDEDTLARLAQPEVTDDPAAPVASKNKKKPV